MAIKKCNVSTGKENFSQRNNKVNPYSSCNTTSLTMGTFYIEKLREMFINSPFYSQYARLEQPEDRLQQALLDWGLNPESHYDLMNGYNKFMGAEIDNFSTSVSLRDLIDDLLSGRPWIGSGTFPGYPKQIQKPFGHIVCVVGMVYENAPYLPSAMIVDDPYGNTMDNWAGSGNDVEIPFNLFADWMKPVKDPAVFWAHRFKKI